ncbi:hypothetical protein ABZ208_14025 [Streptomyces sp. NPDC006208]|uniref:hypothetical protein n=1 Tax=Streptomyces sp. NPDC006208 TaxID=3156734 RepID=UPI0033A8F935
MSDTRIIGSVSVDLGTVKPWIQFGKGDQGTEFAALHVGIALTIHVTDADPESLAAVAEKLLELKAWREQQIAEAEVTA